ncbi:MAG TPA: hypothetical protein VGF45_23640 [Polyangia bacterium]
MSDRQKSQVMRRRPGWFVIVAGLLGLVAGSACGLFFPSEEEVREEFQDFVAKSNMCRDSSECVIASAGCPLGCFAVVHRDHKQAVEDKARALIRSYERAGRACAYDCPPVGVPACINNRCQATEAQTMP